MATRAISSPQSPGRVCRKSRILGYQEVVPRSPQRQSGTAGKSTPDRSSQSACQVSDGGVDADDEIQLLDEEGGIAEVADSRIEIVDGEPWR